LSAWFTSSVVPQTTIHDHREFLKLKFKIYFGVRELTEKIDMALLLSGSSTFIITRALAGTKRRVRACM
jgi:hypothetical protein